MTASRFASGLKGSSNAPVSPRAKGRRKMTTPPMRPPWTDEANILAHCTGCQLCITACPEGILFKGVRNRPEVNFAGNECTFCQECVAACPEPVFRSTQTQSWPMKAEITGSCLTKNGFECDLCHDECPESALVLDRSVRPAMMTIDTDTCTGCGACLSTCPQQSILITDPRTEPGWNPPKRKRAAPKDSAIKLVTGGD